MTYNTRLIIFSTFSIFLITIFSSISPTTSHGHSHDHHHGHSHDHQEHPPAYKYTKQANDPLKTEPQDTPGHFSTHHSEKLQWESTEPKRNSKFRQTKSRLDLKLAVQAVGATLFISIVPFIILFFVPVDNTHEHESFLKVLLSFASGGLLGDAFLHLIPHAMMATSGDGHGHGHSHGPGEESHGGHDFSVGLCVLSGIGLFLMVEKILRLFKTNSHSHDLNLNMADKNDKKRKNSKEDDGKGNAGGDSPRKKEKSDSTVVVKGEPEIKVAGYLNLAADVIHNFTDGLAIGASFLAGGGIGYMTTITVCCHEIPHEIGDYAILLQSGISRKKAIMLQLLTALGAVSGTLVSFVAEGFGQAATTWILPFTAGGFIYIATVSVIPELLQDTKLWQSIKELIALMLGVVLMILVAKFE